MRHFILCTGILMCAARAIGQSAPATTQPAEGSTTPALTKTVVANPNDSPMVRPAKRAVAARVHPSQRRVISLTTSNTRGRLAFATGPTEGPKVPPPTPTGPPVSATAAQQPAGGEQEAAKRAVAVQEKLEQLQIEASRMSAETDEPYGNDVDEDLAEKRLAEIEAERKKLQQSYPPPPPPRE